MCKECAQTEQANETLPLLEAALVAFARNPNEQARREEVRTMVARALCLHDNWARWSILTHGRAYRRAREHWHPLPEVRALNPEHTWSAVLQWVRTHCPVCEAEIAERTPIRCACGEALLTDEPFSPPRQVPMTPEEVQTALLVFASERRPVPQSSQQKQKKPRKITNKVSVKVSQDEDVRHIWTGGASDEQDESGESGGTAPDAPAERDAGGDESALAE